MNNILFQKIIIGKLLLKVLLAVIILSNIVLATDLNGNASTSSYPNNSDLTFNLDGMLTVDSDYIDSSLTVNSGVSGILDTSSGNTFNSTSADINGTLTTQGSSVCKFSTANINGTHNFNVTTDTVYDTVNIAGTLNHNSSIVLTLDNLNIANGDTATINLNSGSISVTNITNNGTLNTTIASGANINLSANAHINELHLSGEVSTVASQSIDTLNITDNTTGTFSGSGAGTIAVNTANIKGTLNQKSGMSLRLTTLNVNSDSVILNGRGKLTVTNQLALVNDLVIAGSGAKNFSGGVLINSGKTLTINDSAAHDLGDVDLAGTLTNNDSNMRKLTSLTIASGSTGIVSGTGDIAVATANINGTHNYTATADTVYDTANIAGTLNQESANTLTLTNINISNGNTANLNVNAGTLDVNTISNSGTMNFNIGKIGKLVNSNPSAIDFSANRSTCTLDFGDKSDTSVYATTSGKFKSSGTATGGTDTIVSVHGVNGVSGTTYANVFDSSLSDGTNDFVDGDLLNTNNRVRMYELANNETDVIVSTDTAGINSEIIGNGGSAQSAGALVEIVDSQSSMNAGDSAYISGLTRLQGVALTRGTQQTIGQEATTGTAQSAIQGVIGSTSAVSNQLTSFRSGGLAVGMTSFSSGGVTAGLADMADAETLATAYETGFISASDKGTYKGVNIWAKGYGCLGEQGTVGEMTGYDFWNLGVIVGLDYEIAQELRVGALLGYSYNKTTGYEDFGKSEDNAIRFGAYSSFTWDSLFIDVSPTMGVHLIDSNRNIWNGTVARGERTGMDFNINVTAGYTFNLPNEFQITTTYNLGYTLFHDPKFVETGAGSANINYESFTSNSLIQDLGVKVGKIFRTSGTLAFLPEAWAGWELEYLDTGGTRNTVNVGQSFQTNMNSMATHRGYWGAGMTALLNDDIAIFGRYDHKIWNTGYSIGFSGGIKISF